MALVEMGPVADCVINIVEPGEAVVMQSVIMIRVRS